MGTEGAIKVRECYRDVGSAVEVLELLWRLGECRRHCGGVKGDGVNIQF